MQLEAFKYDDGDHFNDFTTFEDEEGVVWFMAKDVCDILGLSNPSEALKSLDDDEKLTSVILRSGQNRSANFVNESGLYTLIFRSRKPSANKFRKWITKEVIPSIRKKGYYGKIDRSQSVNFLNRYIDNLHKIDHNYFSVISELFIVLYPAFEKVGYQIPDKSSNGTRITPDASVGKLFSSYLKENNSEHHNTHKYYTHSFPKDDKRKDVEARMYPIDALPDFKRFVHEKWIPEKADKYFRTRDSKALEYLPKLLPQKQEPMSGFNKSFLKVLGK